MSAETARGGGGPRRTMRGGTAGSGTMSDVKRTAGVERTHSQNDARTTELCQHVLSCRLDAHHRVHALLQLLLALIERVLLHRDRLEQQAETPYT